MSKSFMDAIRGVVTEGAKEKTSDGMTPDAKRFAQDLHKVNDPGMKHLVQRDSETKDYEKIFKGGVDKFPTRLADIEPSQAVDKYVEYNEEVEKKKKAKKKHDEEKPGDMSDSEDATGPMESYVSEAGGVNLSRAQAAGLGVAPAAKKPVVSPMAGQSAAAPAVAPKAPAAAPKLAASSPAKGVNAAIGGASATDQQRRAGMNISQVRNQAYGPAYTTAAKAGPSAASTGPASSGGVPTANPTGARAPSQTGQQARMGTSFGAPKPDQGMDKSKLGTTAIQKINQGQAQAKLGTTGAANQRITGDWKGNAQKDRNDRMMAQRGKVAPTVAADNKALGKTAPAAGGARPAVVGKNTPSSPAGAAQAAFNKQQAEKKPFQFTDAEKKGKVSADRLKEFQKQNPGAKLGNFLNAAQGKTAVKGGKNDATAAQKALNVGTAMKKAGSSPTMQGRPAGAPTTSVNVSRPAGGSAAATAARTGGNPTAAPAARPAASVAGSAARMGGNPTAAPAARPAATQVSTAKPVAAVRKPGGMMTQSYEIDVNGTSYVVSEAHAEAITAFVEKHGVVNEGTAGEFIHKEMQHPEKLTAKGKKQKIKQALAIYYSKKRHGENP